MKKTIAILFVLSLFLVACKETKIRPEQKEPIPEVTPETPITEDVEAGISNIGVLDTDLDSKDLDNLDKDLDEINW